MPEDIVNAVKSALEKRFEAVGACSLENDAAAIDNLLKEEVDDRGEQIVSEWDKRPSLVGKAEISKPLPVASKRTVIVEVVERPDLEDVYRLKLYAEVLNPAYVFLISREPFTEATRDFLEEHPHIIHYQMKGTTVFSDNRQMTVMLLGDDGSIELDEKFPLTDPFDPKHMWS